MRSKRGSDKDVETHHKVLDYLITAILPQAIQAIEPVCVREGCYPVVVGGVSVGRCVANSAVARNLMKDVVADDIDIKFVVTSQGQKRLAKILAIRDAFIADVLQRVLLFVDQLGTKCNNDASRGHCHIGIDEGLLNHKVARVRLSYVKSIVLVSRSGQRHPLIDTSILGKGAMNANEALGAVQKTVKSTEPIPYYIHDGVKYATCEYVYYDTVRMLGDRAEYYEDKKSAYAMYKFYKYVVKFMALYALREHIDVLPREMKKLYEEVANGLDREVSKSLGVLKKYM